ncbi:hypothetical protein D1872_234100 [compost metagenome]
MVLCQALKTLDVTLILWMVGINCGINPRKFKLSYSKRQLKSSSQILFLVNALLIFQRVFLSSQKNRGYSMPSGVLRIPPLIIGLAIIGLIMPTIFSLPLPSVYLITGTKVKRQS